MKEVLYGGLLGEMAKQGDTNKVLANLLDLSESSISRRFSGEVEWSIGEIELICNHYGKSYYELFTNEEE